MRLAVDHRKAFKKKSRYRSFCFSVGCQQCNGSLTVEASIVLPIFLSVIMALMSFFEVIQIQTRIQQGRIQLQVLLDIIICLKSQMRQKM